MVAHEHVFVLDVFQHQQLQEEVKELIKNPGAPPSTGGGGVTHHFLQLGLDLLRRQLLAQRRLPQQHVAVVGQQLRTFGLWLSFQAHAVNREQVSAQASSRHGNGHTHPFCFMGSSNLKMVASLTTAL